MKTLLLEETYELIKSLSSTEKRYFKLYSGFQQGDKSYLTLFEIIDKQVCYDEKKINKKFLERNKTKNFPAVKKYLFDQIIASIKSYGAYKDLDSEHTDMIETYKVLQFKGLHRQSGRLLKKIKQITLQDDAFIRHFYVLLLEYLREMFNADESGVDKVKQILEEKKHVFNIIQNYTLVGDPFSYQRLYLRKKLYCRTKKEKEELTRLMAPVLKTTEADMMSRTALSLRNMGLGDYYMAIGNPEKAFKTSRTFLELRKNAGYDKIDTTTISENLHHIALCINCGIYEGFEDALSNFKILLNGISNHQKYMMGYERWYNYSFIYYNNTGQFTKALEFIENEKATMAKVENDFSIKAKITLWYFMAYNHFALKNYKAALKIIQAIMNSANEETEEFHFAKLLLMFIHYDLKNYELLEYQLRSYQRLMNKTNRLYKCEKLIVDFIRKINGADSRKIQEQKLEDLKKNVKNLFKTHYEKGLSHYFDIESWIESELSGKEFAEVVNEKPLIAV